TVTETNAAPLFTLTPTNRTIAELTIMTVTNIATDSDLPANTIVYTLVVTNAAGVVTNAAITNGVITWIPSEAQGPSTNTFTTVVTDNGSPAKSATNTFIVTVTETNIAPVFAGTPTNRTVAKSIPLTVTNSATDA